MYEPVLYTLGLSVRSFNCLSRHFNAFYDKKIADVTIDDILGLFSTGEISRVKNLGKKSIEEIRTRLVANGFMPDEDITAFGCLFCRDLSAPGAFTDISTAEIGRLGTSKMIQHVFVVKHAEDALPHLVIDTFLGPDECASEPETSDIYKKIIRLRHCPMCGRSF